MCKEIRGYIVNFKGRTIRQQTTNPADYVGVSFWIILRLWLRRFFFWVERDRAVGKWKTSLTVAAMVTGIAPSTISTCVMFGLAQASPQSYSDM